MIGGYSSVELLHKLILNLIKFASFCYFPVYYCEAALFETIQSSLFFIDVLKMSATHKHYLYIIQQLVSEHSENIKK